MNVRKWYSNSEEFFAAANTAGSQEEIELKFEQSRKALGLAWTPKLDEFHFNLRLPEVPERLSRRNLCSDVMKLSDSLGWMAPIVIRAKIIMQHTWKIQSLGWDDELPSHVKDAWTIFCEEFSLPGDSHSSVDPNPLFNGHV